jgi:hypothetical protein
VDWIFNVSNVLRPSISRYIRSELGPELVEAIEVGSPQYAYTAGIFHRYM